MNEKSQMDALLASREIREWGVFACALGISAAATKAGFPELAPLLWFTWVIR